MHRLKILDYQHFSDPSPHRQQVGLSDSPEKRESDEPVSVANEIKICGFTQNLFNLKTL